MKIHSYSTKRATAFLNSLREDTCTVKRSIGVTNEDGITKDTIVVVIEDIPCSLSRESKNNLGLTELTPEQESSRMVFLDPKTEVQTGDILEIEHLGMKETLYAGEIFRYHCSLQVKAYQDRVI